MKRPLLGITAAFSLGILIEEFFNIPIFYNFLFVLIFLFLSILFFKSKRQFFLSITAAFLFLGSLVYKNYAALPQNHIKNVIVVNPNFPKQVLLEGQVLNKPDKKITYYNQLRLDFQLKVKAIRVENDWKPASGILLVGVFNPPLNFRYGDEVILEGSLSLPKPATNPGQFDYKKFLEARKIFYILNLKENDFSKIVGHAHVNPIKQFAYAIKERIEKSINRLMPDTEGAILKAILLGERRDIDENINDDFVKTGTVHILAISGLHVGLLASIFILLFKLLRLPFKLWALILTFLLIIYCTMADNRPPVTRATIIILIFLFGRVLKKQQDLLNSLSFAALAILFLNPQDLFDIGFQLSFLTVGSIIYFTPKLETDLIPPTRCKMVKIRFYLIRTVLVSFSAWLGSAPLVARYFNIFSPVTVLANLFVVPWMFFVLATSLTFILFSFFSYTLGLIFSEASSLSIAILLKIVSIFSNIPFSYLFVKSPSWIFIIGFYIFLFLLFNRKYFRIKVKYFLISVVLFFNIFIWHRVFFEGQDFLRISFLDVGKGDSIFLEFPKRGTMLIDGGEGLGVDMGRLVVSRFLASKGVNKIDAVISTHPHTDHIGGLVRILKNFRVRFFIENGEEDLNPLYINCEELVKRKGVKRFILKEGDCIKGFEETEFSVLNPPTQKFYDLNNNSLVLKLKYGNFSVMFCGDIKKEAAFNLLKYDKELASTVLKVPHHGGSLGEAALEFFEKIKPKIAIISLGNKKPNSSILLIFKELRTKIYRTDRDGAIFLTVDKNRSYKCHIDALKK